MIVAGMLLYTASGHVRVTTHPPDAVSNCTPTYQGMLSYSFNSPDSYNDELGYVNNQISVPTNAPSRGDASLRFTPVSGGPIVYWWGGLPFSADGRLAIYYEDIPLPINTHAFSLGFDQGAFS